jgi:CSLREA domain-containing protein
MQRREGQSVITHSSSEALGRESLSQRHDKDIFRRIIVFNRLNYLPTSTLLAIVVLSLMLLACDQTPQPAEHGELSTQMLVATFQVNSQIDAHDANPGDGVCAAANGSCTLRAALEEANASLGKHQVNVPAGTYLLTLGQLEVTDDIIIMGARQGSTVIDAQKNSRVLLIDSSGMRGRERVRAELHFLVMRGGRSQTGGGIRNAMDGILELRYSTVSGNGDMDSHEPDRGVGTSGRCDMGAFELHGSPGNIVWNP